MDKTPKELGFYMPAEWEKHSAVWLAWPYDETTFPGRVNKAEAVFAEMILHLHTDEQVELLVLDEKMKQRAANSLKAKGVDLSKINFYQTDYADVWLRDSGPVFVVNRNQKQLAVTDWQYNAYGKADDPYYEPLLKDDKLPNYINTVLKLPHFEPDIVLEGGAIEINGLGCCLTTEQCLLNPNRNPGKSKQDVEQYLKDYLGAGKTIWLKQGLVNDHTDGHIDELARFVSPSAVVCAYEDNVNDENYKILQDNYKILTAASDQNDQSLNIVKLPMPHLKYEDGSKAPVSYTNFYIGNNVVLAATFNDPNDNKALKILESVFPNRKIVGIDCSDIIYGGGGIHCVTQQQPRI